MVERPAPPPSVLRPFVFVSTALAIPQILILAASAIRVPVGQIGAWLIIVLCVVGAVMFTRRFHGQPSHDGSSVLERVLATGGVLFAMTVAVISLLLTWLRPVYDWDGLYYHVPAIHGWIQAQRVTWLTSPDVPFVNGYPMAVEVMGFLVAQALNSPHWLDASNLWFWPLGFWGVAMAATALGARAPWAWLAGSGLVWSPMFVSESLTAYVDPAFACAVCATFGAASWIVRRGLDSVWGVLLGIQLGLLVGTKGLGVPFVVAVAVFVFALAPPFRWGTNFKGIAIAAGVALCIAGFWFVRNVVVAGNPIHPIQLAAFGRVWFEGYDHRAATLGNLPEWLIHVPEPLRTLKSWFRPDAPILDYGAIGGLGYVWPFGGLPALLTGVSVARTRVWWLLGGLTLAFLLLQPATWWARFTLWLAAAGLPALAACLCTLSDRRGWVAGLFAAAMLTTGVVETTRLLSAEAARGREADGYVTPTAFYFRNLDQSCGDFLAATSIARSDWSRLGVLLGGALAQDLGRSIEWVPRTLGPAELTRLRDRGVEWLVWDQSAAGELPPELAAMAQEVLTFQDGDGVDFVFVKL